MAAGIPNVIRRDNGALFSILAVCVIVLIVSSGDLSAAEISLIDPVQLAGLDAMHVTLDARPAGEWKAGHIPGAFSFSWQEYTGTDRKNIRYRLFPPEKIAGVLGGQGIDETSDVVVYGDAKTSWGGEGWICWVLSKMGHSGKIMLLRGGVQAWMDAGYGLTSEPAAEPAPHIYRYEIDTRTDVSTSVIRENPGQFYLVDTRSTLELLMGRLPGAVHISWKKFYTGRNRGPLSAEETRRLLGSKGIGDDKPVVFYCTGGIRSGWAWTVHRLAGFSGGINYEGGFEAWSRQDASK